MTINFLPHKLILQDYIQYIVREDLTYNDITTELIVNDDRIIEVVINYREPGIVCGIPFAKEVYNLLDPSIEWDTLITEGTKITEKTDIAIVRGPAKPILTGERTVLNLLQKASGIATITNTYVEKLNHTHAKLTDTRKTTPGSRLLEKYAIQIGGAYPHRYNLSDSILIKDNHIELAGSIKEAIKRVRLHCSHTTKIEVETENIDHVKEAIANKADIIMLDNMSIEQTKQMVELIGHQAITEASGNINLDTIEDVAKTGINYISTSAITVKAPVLDVGMDMRSPIIYL